MTEINSLSTQTAVSPQATRAAMTGELLRLLQAQRQTQAVVGAYLAEARMGAQGPEPVHFREVFRTRGPSNYAHGKQIA